MSDISLYGLDAMGHGAMLALLSVFPATLLFWALTRRLATGPRALRPFVTGWASLGLVAVLGVPYALGFERAGFEGAALAGTVLAGFALQLVLSLVLLLLPRRS